MEIVNISRYSIIFLFIFLFRICSNTFLIPVYFNHFKIPDFEYEVSNSFMFIKIMQSSNYK